MSTDVHGSVIYNRQKQKPPRGPSADALDKTNGILLSHKQEWSSDTRYCVDESWNPYAE